MQPTRWSFRWFCLKLAQRARTLLHGYRSRISDKISSKNEISTELLQISDLAVFPGCVKSIESQAVVCPDHSTFEMKGVLNHSMKLFSVDPISVNESSRARIPALRDLAAKIGLSLPENYVPIDWHKDFGSGYRWDEEEFYLDIKVAPERGADIKVPRELSRFQHIGWLASAPDDIGAREFMFEVIDWIDANRLRRGVNWACTMDVALRSINWVWGITFFKKQVMATPEFQKIIIESLYQHATHIIENLEYYEDNTGNHYLADIVGLLHVAVALPQFDESDRWLLFALQELASEMSREVYEDGSAHEASTHYHRLVTELFLTSAILIDRIPDDRVKRLAKVDLRRHRVSPPLQPASKLGLNLEKGEQTMPFEFHQSLMRMVEFTACLTKQNGMVPQFGDNDSARAHKLIPWACGNTSDHSHLLAVACRYYDVESPHALSSDALLEARLIVGDLRYRGGRTPALPTKIPDLRVFPDSGVAVCKRNNAWLAVTCGQNGQHKRGGHGHNDKNGFELNVFGIDFIVDGGCPAYSGDVDQRNLFRSTQSHSTLWPVGKEQDIWAPGLAGLFALPQKSDPKMEVAPDGTIVGRHSGFGPMHKRTFCLKKNNLVIADYFPCHDACLLGFNLAPGIQPVELVENEMEASVGLSHVSGRMIRITVSPARNIVIRKGAFSTGYGQPVETLALEMELVSDKTVTLVEWSEYAEST